MEREYVILVHYGELILKGGNRRWFEQLLQRNIQIALQAYAVNIRREYGRMIITESSKGSIESHVDDIRIRLKKVFGIVQFYMGVQVPSRLEDIQKEVFAQLDTKQFNTFGIRAKRSNKSFPIASGDIERTIGTAVGQRYSVGVNLSTPDQWVFIRIQDNSTIVSTIVEKGAGGLPVGSGGTMLSLLSSGIDSPVASYALARRGAHVQYIHFHSYPLTSTDSTENVKQIVNVLTDNQPGSTVYLVPLAEMQKKIAALTPPRFRVLLYRRAMYQIAEKIAQRIGAKALITGESLGQVASQTIENMTATAYGIRLPILRPLIGMDKEEIVTKARQIGTLEISTQPYEDCCSLLVPANVETKANVEQVVRAQHMIEWDALIAQTIDAIEVMEV